MALPAPARHLHPTPPAVAGGGYRATREPPREPEPERHVEAQRPGELVGVDYFFVGRLHRTKATVWQLTAIDVASSFASAELVACPSSQPATAQAPGCNPSEPLILHDLR